MFISHFVEIFDTAFELFGRMAFAVILCWNFKRLWTILNALACI